MSNCCNISSEKPKFSSSSEVIGVVNAAYSARAREGVSAACASANFEPTLLSTFFIHESIQMRVMSPKHLDTLKSNLSPSPMLRIWDSVVETRWRPLALKR